MNCVTKTVFKGVSFYNCARFSHCIYAGKYYAVIAIFYIANGYYADDKIREVNKTSNDIKELRTEYISSKSDLMFVSKQSEIAKRVEKLGLKEPVVAPMKIEIDTIK